MIQFWDRNRQQALSYPASSAQDFASLGIPTLGEIPVLMDRPKMAIDAMRVSWALFESEQDKKIEELKLALQSIGLSEIAQDRMKKVRQGLIDQKNQFRKLMAPLGLLRERDLKQQQLLSVLTGGSALGYHKYLANIFRDWAWGNNENAISIQCLEKIWSDRRDESLVVLGSGPSRLASDLLSGGFAKRAYAIDYNPLFLCLIAELKKKRVRELSEVVLYPTSADRVVFAHSLQQDRVHSELFPVLADAIYPPFAERSVSQVLTPWLVDVLPWNSLDNFFNNLNSILIDQGEWYCFGSLQFENRPVEMQWSQEEFIATARKFGFELRAQHKAFIPYLENPHSDFHRNEQIRSYRFEKISHFGFQVSKEPVTPQWINDPDQVPPLDPCWDELRTEAAVTQFLMSRLDGKQSLSQIARAFAESFAIDSKESLVMVQTFFVRHWVDLQDHANAD